MSRNPCADHNKASYRLKHHDNPPCCRSQTTFDIRFHSVSTSGSQHQQLHVAINIAQSELLRRSWIPIGDCFFTDILSYLVPPVFRRHSNSTCNGPSWLPRPSAKSNAKHLLFRCRFDDAEQPADDTPTDVRIPGHFSSSQRLEAYLPRLLGSETSIANESKQSPRSGSHESAATSQTPYLYWQFTWTCLDPWIQFSLAPATYAYATSVQLSCKLHQGCDRSSAAATNTAIPPWGALLCTYIPGPDSMSRLAQYHYPESCEVALNVVRQ